MSFIDRVKRILLEKNKVEIEEIERRKKELSKQHEKESEDVEKLKQASEEAVREKSKVQSSIIDKKDLDDLELLYDFMTNLPRIEKTLKHIKSDEKDNEDYIYYLGSNDEVLADEMNMRYELLSKLRRLNRQIVEIKDTDVKDLQDNESLQDEVVEEVQEDVVPKVEEKKGFLARLLANRKKKVEEKPRKESVKKKIPETLFERYKRVIRDFKYYYNSFLDAGFDDIRIVDRITCTKITSKVNSLLATKKRGIDLTDEDEEYLEVMMPHELWKEMSKYYSNISSFITTVQNFESKIDRFENLYNERPELFDISALEKIFEDNRQLAIDLKSKNRHASTKSGEVAKKKQSEKEIRAQLSVLDNKSRILQDKNSSIRSAKSLSELGFRNKEDAVKKLGIESKDYVVIPIPNSIMDINDVFNDEKRLRIETKGRVVYSSYSNDVAIGIINSIEIDKNASSVLMVPISSIRKEDIDNIRNGRIALNKSVLGLKGVEIIAPEGKGLKTGNSNIRINRYSFGNIEKQVEMFLGEDFEKSPGSVENYDIFKGISNTSDKEKRLKRDAVRKCLFESFNDEITSLDLISVNGKPFFLNKNDEKELKYGNKSEDFNEQFLMDIADKIEEYLINYQGNGSVVDSLYQKLLLEFMRINKKAKADYYEEDDTKVAINGKSFSIKPSLPSKDSLVAKRYTRPREDVVYKTMKLANLVNRFAHVVEENEELQNVLYAVKLDLIESAIDLSENNPNIKLKRNFDENKMVTSVTLEIPGYNMIALHVKDRGSSLLRKVNNLGETGMDVLQSSVILIPGVNRELLNELKGMSEEDRMKAFLGLDSRTFYKLVLRMGYSEEKITSESERKKFIKKMISDKKITELLRENDELEK